MIREATDDDADPLGRVHVRAWRAGYRAMMPDAFLEALDERARSRQWHARLTGGLGTSEKVFIAQRAGALVGFAGIGPDRSELGVGELYVLNVEPDAWGAGIGRALLAHATKALAEVGHREAILWAGRAHLIWLDLWATRPAGA